VRRLASIALVAAALAGCSRLVILNDPLTAAEHNDLGVAYERSGRIELAAREYRRALKRDRRYTRAIVNLGNVEAAGGRWGSAERRYRSALRLEPDHVDALNNLAYALLRQEKDLGRAEELARRAVALSPGRDSIPRATLAEILARRPR
jgi:tetratricopeptide (TPR) repeat protein